MRLFITALFIFIGVNANASENACWQNASTQTKLNQCASLDFKTADKELNRVYEAIRQRYSEQPKFLSTLKNAQLAWIKLRDADVALHYPENNKLVAYGSAYYMCSLNVKTKITLQRIEFLKQWLNGAEEGDMCSGSIKPIGDLDNQNMPK